MKLKPENIYVLWDVEHSPNIMSAYTSKKEAEKDLKTRVDSGKVVRRWSAEISTLAELINDVKDEVRFYCD